MATGDGRKKKKKSTGAVSVRTLERSGTSRSATQKRKAEKKYKTMTSAQKNRALKKRNRKAKKVMGKIAKSVGSRHRENPASEMAAKRVKIAVDMEKKSAKQSAKTGGLSPRKTPSKMQTARWTRKLKKAGLSTGKSGSGITRPSGQTQSKRKTVRSFKKAGLSRGKKK